MRLLGLRTFWADNHGVAAIEAALLFPVLVLVFGGGIELMGMLDARRAVSNASFSLANAAASSFRIDGQKRDILRLGHDAVIENANLDDVRVVLKGYERLTNGSFNEIWSWQMVGPDVTMTQAEISTTLRDNVSAREGLVVAVVEATRESLFAEIVPSMGTIRGFHAQVPTRTSVPIYR